MKNLFLLLVTLLSGIVVTQAQTISGTVTQNGNPLANLTVYLSDTTALGGTTYSTLTNTQGQYSYTTTWNSQTVGVSIVDSCNYTAVFLTASGSGQTNVDFNLTCANTTLSGLVSVGAQPLPNHSITISDPAFQSTYTVLTDAQGMYSQILSGSSGSVNISGTDTCNTPFYYTVTKNGSSVTQNIALSPCTPAVLSGMVTVNGWPVPNHAVNITDSLTFGGPVTVYTDAQGNYSYTASSPHTQLYVTSDDTCGIPSFNQQIQLTGQSLTQNITLSPCANATVTGMVTINGWPVPNHLVTIVDSNNYNNPSLPLWNQVYTDAQGNYTYTASTPNTALQVRCSDTCGTLSFNQVVHPQGQVLTQNIALNPCTTGPVQVSGSVTVNGWPVPNHYIYITQSSSAGTFNYVSTTDAQGNYTFTSSATNSLLVIASNDTCGNPIPNQTFQLAGQNVTYNILLNPCVGTSGSTLSGMVTVNGWPVPNHLVLITDSNSTPQTNYIYTDLQGNYTYTASPASAQLYVYSNDTCGNYSFAQHVQLSGQNLTQNIALNPCNIAPPPPPPVLNITGKIFKANSVCSANEGMVLLIKYHYDTLAQSMMLSSIDTTYTDSSGFYDFYNVTPITASASGYLVKAALEPISPDYASYLPTYADSALLWSQAQQASLNGWTDIYLVSGSNPGGPCFVGGSVLQGANKVGDPLEGHTVLLLDQDHKAVSFAVSDANGYYEFDQIDYGTYYMHLESPIKTNYEQKVVLSPGHSSEDVNFDVHTIYTEPIVVTDVQSFVSSDISISPNPTSDRFTVAGLTALGQEATISITNALGQLIETRSIGSREYVEFDASEYPSGIYFIQISENNVPAVHAKLMVR